MQIFNHLVIITLICSSFADFIPQGTIALPEGVIDMEFSSDQKYLAILNDSAIVVYHGVTGRFLKNIKLNGGVPTSLSFSESGSNVAVGFKNGAIEVYSINGEKASELLIAAVEHDNDSGEVKDLCWLADAKRIVYGDTENHLYLLDVESSRTSIGYDVEASITSIACSLRLSNQFAISKTVGTEFKIEILELTFNDAEPIKSKFTYLNEFLMNSITYSRATDNLYVVGEEEKIIGYQIKSKELKPIVNIETKGDKGFSKVSVVEDEKDNGVNTIAFSNSAKVIIVRKNKNSTSTSTIQDDPQEVFESPSGKFALGPFGANFVFDANKTAGDFYGACKIGNFLNELTSTCGNCSFACSVCYSAPNLCYKCQGSFFFDGIQSCVACVSHCSSCQDKLTCDSCEKGFFKKENICESCDINCEECSNLNQCTKCKEEYEENNGICEIPDDDNGIPTWLIVLLVIIVVAFAIAGTLEFILAIIIWRIKKKKRSLLLSHSDDAERAELENARN